MSPSLTSAEPAPAFPVPGQPSWQRLAAPLLAALLVVAATALAGNLGALAGGLGAAVAVLCGVLIGRRFAGAVATRTSGTPGDGAHLMAREIVPVWQRQIEAARSGADHNVASLLESFSGLSDGLASAAGLAEQGKPVEIGVGAVDDLIDRNGTTLDELIAPMQQLRHLRHDMLAQLGELGGMLQRLDRLAKEVRTIGRHGGVVALNASIEANRAGQAQDGFGVVAREVRAMANRAGAAGDGLVSELDAAARRLTELRRACELADRGDDELQIEARVRARRVVSALLGEIHTALSAGGELRELSLGLRDELDRVLQGFQFQDKLSQMLDSVRNDMVRFGNWLESGNGATHADVAGWLETLERSYTMEDQRTQHHEMVHIERNSGVEFF